MVQWSGLSTFTAEGPGSIPGWGIKIPQATYFGQKKKNKRWKTRKGGERLRLAGSTVLGLPWGFSSLDSTVLMQRA